MILEQYVSFFTFSLQNVLSIPIQELHGIENHVGIRIIPTKSVQTKDGIENEIG